MALTDAFLLDPPPVDTWTALRDMSLTHALLLSEPDDLVLSELGLAREIWFGLRTDGQRGKGTLADPYNATVQFLTPSAIPSMSRYEEEITFNIAEGHGLVVGDLVKISNVTGDAAEKINGIRHVTEVGTTYFKTVLWYDPEADPEADPEGTATWAKVVYPMDDMLRSLSQGAVKNITIHLLAGEFETRGGCPLAPANHTWYLRDGWKIVGSGMYTTTLKLTGCAVEGAPYAVILSASPFGLEPSDYQEVRDLTVDCNVDGQPVWTVHCAGVQLGSNFGLIERVRAINWGSKAVWECFVLWGGGVHPSIDPLGIKGCVIRGCVVEQPGQNNSYSGAILMSISGGGEDPWEDEKGFMRMSVLQDNFLCGTRRGNAPAGTNLVKTLTYVRQNGVSVAFGKSDYVHGQVTGEYMIIILANDPVNGFGGSVYNGWKRLTNVTSEYTFEYELWDEITSMDVSGTTITVHTRAKHGLALGNQVRIKRVKGNNAAAVAMLMGVQTVTQIVDANTFKFVASSAPTLPLKQVKSYENTPYPNGFMCYGLYSPDPGGNALDENGLYRGTTRFGFGYGGSGLDGQGGNFVVNNRFYDLQGAGPYHDTWNSDEIYVKGNYYKKVAVGPGQNLAGYGATYGSWGAGAPVGSITFSGNIATVIATAYHGFAPGETVEITGATGASANLFNGHFRILQVPDPATFTYQMDGTPTQGAGSGVQYRYTHKSLKVAATSLVQDTTFDPTGATALLTLPEGHGLRIDDAIVGAALSFTVEGSNPSSPYAGLKTPLVPTKKDIVASSRTNPVVLTVIGHGYSNGDRVYVQAVVRNHIANGYHTIQNVTTNTFELAGVDGTGMEDAGWGQVGSMTVQRLNDAFPAVNQVRYSLGTTTPGSVPSGIKYYTEDLFRLSWIVAVQGDKVTVETARPHGLEAGDEIGVEDARGASGPDINGNWLVESVETGRKGRVIEVRVVATSHVNLTGSAVIDAVTVVDGDRVLCTAQSNAKANGIYVVNTGGAWTRAQDASLWSDFQKLKRIGVRSGLARGSWIGVEPFWLTANHWLYRLWMCTAPATGVLETDPITFVPQKNSFTFSVTPGTNPSSCSFLRFRKLWFTRRAIIEDNIVECHVTKNAWGPAAGIVFYSGSYRRGSTFKSVILRRNTIRWEDGERHDEIPTVYPIQVNKVEQLIAEDNIIDMGDKYSRIRGYEIRNVIARGNKTSWGEPVRVWDDAYSKFWEDREFNYDSHHRKNLPTGLNTPLFEIPLDLETMVAGQVLYSIELVTNTNVLKTLAGVFSFAAMNRGGTITAYVAKDSSADARDAVLCSDGSQTIAVDWTIVTDATKMTMRVRETENASVNILRVNYNLINMTPFAFVKHL
jgi:hypothetical protein